MPWWGMKSFVRFAAVFGLISALLPGLAAARTVNVKVSEKTCAELTEHTADADVAYRPGVGADGEAVVSASLGGGFQVKPPTEISIPIQIAPGPGSSNFSTSDTTIGTVTYKNGRVYYNGKPVQDDEAARISKLCQQQNRSGR